MKCENCGKNEVTFVYQSNINGRVDERHLCMECAEKLGYSQRIAARNQRMMQNFFGRNSLFGKSLLEDFFSPSLMAGNNWLLEDPFEDFFAEMPVLSAAPIRTEKKQDQTLVGEAEQSQFSRQRELNALREEIKNAIKTENFERAAELRDQIRSLESRHAATEKPEKQMGQE